MTTTPTAVRRNVAALPWLRALAFAGVTYAALAALGFYPAAVAPIVALSVGALGLFSPGIGVLVFLLATGIPLAAGDIVAGVLFLVLGFGVIQYLSESHGRAFVVISLAFLATLLKTEWAVVVLAGYLLGASNGAVVALVACLLIQSAGLLTGAGSIGTLATGGVTPALVDLKALAGFKDPLTFGWVLPAISRIDPDAFFKAVTSPRPPPPDRRAGRGEGQAHGRRRPAGCVRRSCRGARRGGEHGGRARVVQRVQAR